MAKPTAILESKQSFLSSVHSGDVESGEGSTGSGTGSSPEDEVKKRIQIAGEESKAVCYLRALLFLVLGSVACGVSFAVYWYSREADKTEFKRSFEDQARKVTDSFEAQAADRLLAIENLASGITSSAIAEGQTWPNVVVSDFGT